jgi:hypothetical protein
MLRVSERAASKHVSPVLTEWLWPDHANAHQTNSPGTGVPVTRKPEDYPVEDWLTFPGAMLNFLRCCPVSEQRRNPVYAVAHTVCVFFSKSRKASGPFHPSFSSVYRQRPVSMFLSKPVAQSAGRADLLP